MFVQKPTKESTLVLHRLVVEKHGSHNQSSHGGKGGGKGGGGGGGSAPSGANSPEADKQRSTIAAVLEDDMAYAQNQLDNMREDNLSNAESVLVDRAITKIESAKKDFQDAKKLKGKEQTEKMQTGVGKIFSATDQLSIIDDKQVSEITGTILDDVQATFGDSDSTFTDLGLDVDDLFGP